MSSLNNVNKLSLAEKVARDLPNLNKLLIDRGMAIDSLPKIVKNRVSVFWVDVAEMLAPITRVTSDLHSNEECLAVGVCLKKSDEVEEVVLLCEVGEGKYAVYVSDHVKEYILEQYRKIYRENIKLNDTPWSSGWLEDVLAGNHPYVKVPSKVKEIEADYVDVKHEDTKSENAEIVVPVSV